MSDSGKTTLLRCIKFLEKADSGKATFGDLQVNLHDASKKDIHTIRQNTAFVFQNYNLSNNKTALENVTEGLIIVVKYLNTKQLILVKKLWKR